MLGARLYPAYTENPIPNMERMKREYHAEVYAGGPAVAYRETISQAGKFDYTLKKQTGGSYHSVDSSELAFRVAAKHGFEQAFAFFEEVGELVCNLTRFFLLKAIA